MTTFPELREAQRHVSEFSGDLDSDEFKSRIEVLRFRAALSADAVLAHIDAQAAEIERLSLGVALWQALYRRAINEANGLTNYVEERPELRRAERNLEAIQADARAALEQTK